MSATQQLVYLPTVDAEKFIANVEALWISGTTLAVDLVFPAFPTNLGHWTEILLPMLSALKDGSWTEHVQFPEQQQDKLPGECRSCSFESVPEPARYGCCCLVAFELYFCRAGVQ
jgi:hypothetical protein